MAGAEFVGALAVACGALSGSDRLFQGLYLLWWIVAVHGNHALDFMDLDHSHANLRWLSVATVILLAAALARRARRQYGRLRPRAAVARS